MISTTSIDTQAIFSTVQAMRRQEKPHTGFMRALTRANLIVCLRTGPFTLMPSSISTAAVIWRPGATK
jgi:hypothetical protein